MNRKKLLIASGLMGIILVLLSIGMFLSHISFSDNNSKVISNSSNVTDEYLSFDNSTPEATAISIARLNLGIVGFNRNTVSNASLTPDGKYWIVEIYYSYGYDDEGTDKWIVTIDAKTLDSKSKAVDTSYNENNENSQIWRSLDELKATYIADIQRDKVDYKITRPNKLNEVYKEIWQVPLYKHNYEKNEWEQTGYIYVDLKTGKSKNTWKEFNDAAGTDGWLTLKQVDDTSVKMGIGPIPFRDALRNLYPE